ncbi:hypothetical protein BKA66DRAFT_439508 [Pyrenochaeta sp. MPI-SDFR-AT-0127]|nr:hypothetical protein BKA66DRAFT_439508 [Pyrenochaeta sp. MPI-SDFR-AT-0127]
MHWRHIKLRNPLRPRTLTYREALLAKEAADKRAEEEEKKEVEKHRSGSLARLERREPIWPQLKRLFGSFVYMGFRKMPLLEEERLSEVRAAAAYVYEDELGSQWNEQQEPKEIEDEENWETEWGAGWEGNWEGILEEGNWEDILQKGEIVSVMNRGRGRTLTF